jgi:hypothetical protein
LNQSPDASDLIEAPESPEGKVAFAKMTGLKCAASARLFAPYSDALAVYGQTPAKLAEFVDNIINVPYKIRNSVLRRVT